ncbi:MAG: lysostaphin resistance A-like protein [Pseudonocardiaceae bacterium]
MSAVVPKVIPDTRRGWLMLACAVAAEVTFLVVSVLVLLPFVLAVRHGGAGPVAPRLSGGALVIVLVVPTVVAAVVAVTGAGLLVRGQGNLAHRLRAQLSVQWRPRDVGVGLALGIGGMVITLPAGALWARWVGSGQANSTVGEVFGGQRLSLGLGLTLFFVVWLLAPVCEEVIYRGVLWRALEYWRWNRWVIFGLTTVLFSFAHLELLRTPLLVVVALPIGLARLFTGNLLASIVAHQANNFLPAIGLLLITQGAVPG